MSVSLPIYSAASCAVPVPGTKSTDLLSYNEIIFLTITIFRYTLALHYVTLIKTNLAWKTVTEFASNWGNYYLCLKR